MFPIRLAISVFISDITSMLLMNLFNMKPEWIVWVFGLSFLLSFLLSSKLGLKKEETTNFTFSKKEKKWTSICFYTLLAFFILPKISYVLEPFLGHVVGATNSDDWFHFQELSSLINTPRYPAVLSYDSTSYYSHYYAPWMIIVFLYYLFPFSFVTIKMVYFFGYSFYLYLVLYGFVFFAKKVSKSKKQFFLLLWISLIAGGLESLFTLVPDGYENFWWVRDGFGFNMQITDFSTMFFWVIHHLSSAVSLFICYFLVNEMKQKRMDKKTGSLVVSLLLVYSFYSSVFVFLGASPYLIYFFIKGIKNKEKEWIFISITSAIMSFSILWIFMNKEDNFHFAFMANVKHVFGFYPADILITVCYFAFVLFLRFPVNIYLFGRVLRREKIEIFDKHMLLLSIPFWLSIIFIASPQYNDYAMRGYIVPIHIFNYVVSKYAEKINLKKIGIIIVIAICSLQPIGEGLIRYTSLVNSFTYTQNAKALDEIYQYNTNRNVKEVDYNTFSQNLKDFIKNGGFDYYQIEKIPLNYKKLLNGDDMVVMNKGPFSIWSFMKWK